MCTLIRAKAILVHEGNSSILRYELRVIERSFLPSINVGKKKKIHGTCYRLLPIVYLNTDIFIAELLFPGTTLMKSDNITRENLVKYQFYEPVSWHVTCRLDYDVRVIQ